MARQTEDKTDENQGSVLVFMLNGGMGSKIVDAGGKLKGITFRVKELDVLLVVRADFDGRQMVAFVGGSTMAKTVVELEEELFASSLKWRVDRFAR